MSTTPEPQRTQGSARRILGIAGRVLGCLLTFIVALLGGVMLHLNLPIARRIAMNQVSGILASTFEGQITIEALGGIGAHQLQGISVRLRDPKGTEVLSVIGVQIKLSVVGIARSALGGKGPLAVDLSELTIDAVDANLDTNEKGTLRLLDALESRDKSPADPKARGVRISIGQLVVKHVWAHGQMQGAPTIDAELDELLGGVLVSPKTTNVDVNNVMVRTRGMPSGANPRGVAVVHLAMPSKTGASMGIEGNFGGDAGGVPLKASGTMDGSRVDAVADIPKTKAEMLRALVAEAPIYDDIDAHAEVHGTLPDLEATSRMHVGPAAIDAKANANLGTDTQLHATVAMHAVDLRSFSPTAPASTLGDTMTVSLVMKPEGTITGDFESSFEGGRVGPNDLPKAKIHGNFAKGKEGPPIVHAVAAIDERGAPTDVVVDMRSENSKSVIDVNLKIRAPNLEAVPRVGPIARGSAQADIKATIHLDDSTFEAKVNADLAGIERPGMGSLHHARVDGQASGPFANPLMEVTLRGDGVVAQGVKLSRVNLHARGHTSNGELEFTLTPEDKTLSPIDGHADVQISGQRSVSLSLGGFGAPLTFHGKMGGGSMEVQASTTDLDLGLVAKFLHQEAALKGGHLALDVDMKTKRDGALGHVLLDVSHASLKHIPNANAHIDLTFLERRLIASVRADLGDVGHAYFTTPSLDLGGTPLDPEAWKKAAGTVQIDAKVDIAKVSTLFPADSLPLGEMAGTLIVNGEVGRATPTDHPNLSLSAKTHGLVLAAKSPPSPPGVPPTRVVAPPSWRTTGVDVELNAKLDSGTGKVAFDSRLFDTDGTIASLGVDSTLPYHELMANPDGAAARLETVPFKAKIAVPRRRLNRFPPAAQTKGIRGDVELSADIEGTARAPKLDLTLNANRVKSAQSPLGVPINADIVAHYERGEGKVELKVATPKSSVLDGTLAMHGDVAAFLDNTGPSPVPWDASVDLHASSFPLETVSMLTDRDVAGKLSGDIAIDDIHKDAHAKITLTLADLHIGQAVYNKGAVNVTLDGKTAAVALRLDQKDGFAEAKAGAGTKWGSELAPSLDKSKPLTASFQAHNFRAAAVLPFVSGTFNELDGFVDANANVVTGAGGTDPKFEGSIALRDGLIQLPSLGEEFHGVTAKVTLRPGGEVRVDDVVAFGTTGKLTANAQAKIDGLTFHDAKAALDIPTRQPLPLNVQGVEVGEAFGHVDVQANAVPGGIDLTVNVPRWHTALPESDKHTVQDLDRAEFIRIGVHRGPEQTLVLLPLDAADLIPEVPRDKAAMKITVRVKLGSDVEIKRGTSLKVSLTGGPVLELTDKARVSGQIRLKTGIIEVQGKRFQIESGTVTFVGDDSTNPEIVATAGWTAPEGTRIFADFVGPLRTGKVTLRAEPSLPNSEILALIVFGTADGANATTPPDKKADTTTQAVGMGGGVATQGLNKALSDMTGLDNAQFRVDTTSSANPRPELEIQIAKDISVGVATVLGVPPPDQPDQVFGKADWRFHRNWSLETMFGNLGTTMFDAVWDYRY